MGDNKRTFMCWSPGCWEEAEGIYAEEKREAVRTFALLRARGMVPHSVFDVVVADGGGGSISRFRVNLSIYMESMGSPSNGGQDG